MKRLYILGTILSLCLIVSSCEPENVRGGRRLYKAYFDYILKDPSSLVIYSEKYTVGEEKNSIVWELDYGARNSLGGMVREEIEFTTYGDYWIRLSPLYGGESYDVSELKGK